MDPPKLIYIPKTEETFVSVGGFLCVFLVVGFVCFGVVVVVVFFCVFFVVFFWGGVP